jgi:hypothetical protein
MEICTVPTPDEVTQAEIARRAFALYESEGAPDGQDLRHWLQAERELTEAGIMTFTTNGDDIVVRVRIGNMAPSDLIFSISSKSLILFGLRKEDDVDSGTGPLLRTIEFPIPVDPSRAEAQITGDTMVLVLPKCRCSQEQPA